jgi:mannose-6-phosphate isomerase-like protein (cupin superfamily)
MGKCKSELDFQQKVYTGDAVFVPAGFWHNIINTEKTSLKVSSIYAPPHHPRGTVQATKADAEYE